MFHRRLPHPPAPRATDGSVQVSGTSNGGGDNVSGVDGGGGAWDDEKIRRWVRGVTEVVVLLSLEVFIPFLFVGLF